MEGQTRNTGHHSHSVHSLFPSCLCSAVIQIIDLLDDAAVSPDGNAVYEVAYQASKATRTLRDKVETSLFLGDMVLFGGRKRPVPPLHSREANARKTGTNVQDPQTPDSVHTEAAPASRVRALQLHNRIRHVLRTNAARGRTEADRNRSLAPLDGQTPLSSRSDNFTEMQCSQVVHSVHGIMFKDLKQILRKEQCDASILLTANVPSAKKIIIDESQGGSIFGVYDLGVVC